MHGCYNDIGHGCLILDHDILHNNGHDTDYDWFNSDTDSDYDWSDYDSEENFDYINGLVEEMASYVQCYYNKRPMRTSILTGSGYMEEVKDGNPKQCFEMFRMSLRLFYHFIDDLKRHGYLKEGKGHVNVQESVAMFLYIIGHNTRMRCVADKFQHSIEMVACKFRRVLRAIHSYGQHLIKPDPNVTGLPRHLQVNKYHTWFERCIGAIDGIHVSARPLTGKTQQYKSKKNTVTTNVMCACDHDMRFIYVHSGWEGSANDSRVLEEAIKDPKHGFPWPPEGSYYLVDSRYPIGTSFLPPHKSTCYHAQEFRSSNRQPTTKKELYNYRHSSLHMVIERCFGVLKARFPILNSMLNFKPLRQWYVISACCATHNFICMNSRSDELFHNWENADVSGGAAQNSGNGSAGSSTSTTTQRHVREMSDQAKRAMNRFRDDIIDRMWIDYEHHRH